MGSNPPSATGAIRQAQEARKRQSKPRNLLLRLARRWRGVLAFKRFTNNQAERDLRMQQKISGTFRSTDARSYISTIRKNGVNVIEASASSPAIRATLPHVGYPG